MATFAQYGLIFTLSGFLIFHFLVLFKIIPYSTVWGSRLKSDKEMYRFEIVSILLNSFFLIMLFVHSNILTISFSEIIMKIFFWTMSVIFTINTLGNMVSKNKLEKLLFTPLTILLTIFSLILALTN